MSFDLPLLVGHDGIAFPHRCPGRDCAIQRWIADRTRLDRLVFKWVEKPLSEAKLETADFAPERLLRSKEYQSGGSKRKRATEPLMRS